MFSTDESLTRMLNKFRLTYGIDIRCRIENGQCKLTKVGNRPCKDELLIEFDNTL